MRIFLTWNIRTSSNPNTIYTLWDFWWNVNALKSVTYTIFHHFHQVYKNNPEQSHYNESNLNQYNNLCLSQSYFQNDVWNIILSSSPFSWTTRETRPRWCRWCMRDYFQHCFHYTWRKDLLGAHLDYKKIRIDK